MSSTTSDVNNISDTQSIPKRTRYPLQLEIATIFTLLIAILGVTLVWYNFSENKKVTLLAANDSFSRITQQTANNIRRLYAPGEALVSLTVQLETAEINLLSNRKTLLNYFAESLRIAEHISSIYVGHADGGFYMVRAIRGNAQVREKFTAPEQASFVVKSVEVTDAGKFFQTFYYYTEDLSFLGSSEVTETDYDPRQRRWYRLAIESDKQITSGFYTYESTGEIGTTIAQQMPSGQAVVAADLTLSEITSGLAKQKVTPSSQLLVFNTQGMVLTFPEVLKNSVNDLQNDISLVRLAKLNDLQNPVFEKLHDRFDAGMKQGQMSLKVNSRDWMGSISQLPIRSGAEVYLAVLVPQDELLADVIRLRTHSVIISLVLLIIAIIIAWWVARRISHSLRTLASEAESVRELKLDTPITVRSRIMEVDDLATTMGVMKSSVQQFVEISKALSAEKNFNRLLERILEEARSVCNADSGSIFLYDDEKQLAEFSVTCNKRMKIHCGGTSDVEIPYAPLDFKIISTNLVEKHVTLNGKTLTIDNISANQEFDFSQLKKRYEQDDYKCQSLLYLPLRNRQEEVIGVLELVNARDKYDDTLTTFSPEIVSYAEALSSQVAITLDNQRLLKAQKDLLDSFIQLIAGAIDAKSPYTSGHCQRVPELARMLAEAAQNSNAEPFNDFVLSEDEWYELHIASWLHDCGKVTTPEYVVDKATKLECVYNRLHEIRMRFEILWRDAQIEFYKAAAEGGQNRETLKKRLDEQFKQLTDDFEFIAECNEGGEYMAPERIDRLRQVGSQTWMRHFNDRLGLSYDELIRKQRTPEPVLPVEEKLLADKDEHIVPRDDNGKPFGDNPYGFRMDVPEQAYNYGELYNLGVARGTLSDEDRFKINEHITQTIILLNKLPFPKELRRVPTWAGNHHEKLDGTGYPRKLKADELSTQERIMAVADIFEALTASDRPYKKAKTLSESIRIMSFMRNDGHVCPKIFDLFLSSGVYKDYAKQFLSPQQVDKVDIEQFMTVKAP